MQIMIPRFSKFNTLLCYLLLGSIVLLIGTVYSLNNVTNEFLYQNMAFLEYAYDYSFLPTYDYSVGEGIFSFVSVGPADPLFLLIVAKVCNLHAEIIQYLPIGIILISLAYFIFCKQFSSLKWLPFLMAIYIAFECSHISVIYSVFAYALTFPLYIMVVALFFRYFRKNGSIFHMIVVLIIFVALNFIHYTATTWVIIFIYIYFVLSCFISGPFSISKNLNKSLFYLISVMTILFLFFNKTLYNMYLPPILNGNVGIEYSISIFEEKVLNFIHGTHIQEMSKYIDTSSVTPIVGQFSVLHILVILIPIVIILIQKSMEYLIFKEQPKITNENIIMISIFCVGVFDIIFYALRGNVSTKYISIIFPLISVYCIDKIKVKNLGKILLVLLFLILLIKFSLFWNMGYFQQTPSYGSSKDAGSWLYAHNHESEISLLSDLHTYGLFLVIGTQSKTIPSIQYYDSNLYDLVVNTARQSGSGTLNQYCDYVVVNHRYQNMPVKSFWWGVFEPFSKYGFQIDHNKQINKIYNNNLVYLFKPTDLY